MKTEFWLENLKERDHSENLGIGESIILKWILGTFGLEVWIGFIWLSIGTFGRLL
jgi:hypothetical protein